MFLLCFILIYLLWQGDKLVWIAHPTASAWRRKINLEHHGIKCPPPWLWLLLETASYTVMADRLPHVLTPEWLHFYLSQPGDPTLQPHSFFPVSQGLSNWHQPPNASLVFLKQIPKSTKNLRRLFSWGFSPFVERFLTFCFLPAFIHPLLPQPPHTAQISNTLDAGAWVNFLTSYPVFRLKPPYLSFMQEQNLLSYLFPDSKSPRFSNMYQKVSSL